MGYNLASYINKACVSVFVLFFQQSYYHIVLPTSNFRWIVSSQAAVKIEMQLAYHQLVNWLIVRYFTPYLQYSSRIKPAISSSPSFYSIVIAGRFSLNASLKDIKFMYLWVFVRSIKVKLYIHMYLWVYVRSYRLLNVMFFSKKIEEMKHIQFWFSNIKQYMVMGNRV